jgi:hypothetical protein
MPIRFTCPHCRQKLSVAQRKAGTATECPRCHGTLTVPEPPAETKATGEQPAANAPLGEAPEFLPEADEFAGLELIYETASEPKAPPAPSRFREEVAVPRYIIYLQGGLIAVVALVSLAIGMLLGSTFGGRSENEARSGVVSGSVTYAEGPRSRVDVGAVVMLLPQGRRPDEKIPINGLRPADRQADEGEKGIAMLRDVGGSYARADENGRFELQAPNSGRYWLVVISREKKRAGAGRELRNADLAKLARFFESAAGLLGDREFRISEEMIRGDRRVDVAFD